MYSKLQSLRSYLYMCADMYDHVPPDQPRHLQESSSLYLHAGRVATELALECMQVFGANGYSQEYPCGRILADAKLYEIGGGTREIRQWLVGR